MTLLELVNEVLTRIREPSVTAASGDTYVEMIRALVNDAKRHVEGAWDWSVLREEQAYTITAGNSTQVLTNSDQPGFKILAAYNSTNRYTPLRARTLSWARRTVDPLDTPATGTIQNYWLQPPSRGVQTKTLEFYPVADVNQGVLVDVLYNQPDLSADTDELLVPSLPVILFATAYAARERGEMGGTSVPEWLVMADRALGDAISYDSTLFPEELVYDAGYRWQTNNRT